MQGMHKGMSDITKQDEAISVELMGALMGEFEKDWITVTQESLATDDKVSEVYQHQMTFFTNLILERTVQSNHTVASPFHGCH